MKKIFSSSIVLLVCLFFIFSYSSSHISLLHSNSITPYSVQALNSIAVMKNTKAIDLLRKTIVFILAWIAGFQSLMTEV